MEYLIGLAVTAVMLLLGLLIGGAVEARALDEIEHLAGALEQRAVRGRVVGHEELADDLVGHLVAQGLFDLEPHIGHEVVRRDGQRASGRVPAAQPPARVTQLDRGHRETPADVLVVELVPARGEGVEPAALSLLGKLDVGAGSAQGTLLKRPTSTLVSTEPETETW